MTLAQLVHLLLSLNKVNGPNELLKFENRWRTTMGASFGGERVVVRGKDLFQQLSRLSWMQLFLFGITGKIFNEKQAKLFEGIWVLATSYPDPRIWNNRVGSLAGTARSTGCLGVSAAVAVSEASIYGRRPDIRSMNFLVRTRRELDLGRDLKELIKNELSRYRGIFGYGRPIVKKDERIEPLMKLARELHFADGDYVNLAFKVEKELIAGRWRLQMNVAALIAALAADQGLSEREFYFYMLPSFIGGIVPCFIEANEHQEGTFLPLRCECINYSGPQQRQWLSTKST